MDPLQIFKKYAAAFEVAVASGRWNLVEQFFTDDAVYVVEKGPPLGGVRESRDAVMDFIQWSVNDFDLRFERRTATITEGPVEKDGGVWLRWRLDYETPGLPLLSVSGVETLAFEEGKIRRIEDHYDPGSMEAIESFFKAHGENLVVKH